MRDKRGPIYIKTENVVKLQYTGYSPDIIICVTTDEAFPVPRLMTTENMYEAKDFYQTVQGAMKESKVMAKRWNKDRKNS